MLLIVLALFWVALLAPVVVRRIRDGGTERSIEHFHNEHEVLSRQDYAVAPAHRLDLPDQPAAYVADRASRPRLTVVHADDTFGSLESRSSWEEWSEDYDFDDRHEDRASVAAPIAANHYARAYASRPSEPVAATYYEAPLRSRSMRVQRRRVFAGLLATAVVLTALAFFVGSSIVVDLAALAWFALVAFVALALYAVSQGYLSESSLPLRLPQRRRLAVVEPLYGRDGTADEDEGGEYAYYEDDVEEQWSPPVQRRRAFG